MEYISEIDLILDLSDESNNDTHDAWYNEDLENNSIFNKICYHIKKIYYYFFLLL